MILFPTGIQISTAEKLCLLHVVENPEQWLTNSVHDKAMACKARLIAQWTPQLEADPNIPSMPGTEQATLALIFAQTDAKARKWTWERKVGGRTRTMPKTGYRTRVQHDAEIGERLSTHNRDKFAAQERSESSVTLVPRGIKISKAEADCLLGIIQDIDEWVIGALAGMVNRGKKQMITQYLPVLKADPSVKTTPDTEEDFIHAVVERTEYQTMPQQLAAIQAAREAVVDV